MKDNIKNKANKVKSWMRDHKKEIILTGSGILVTIGVIVFLKKSLNKEGDQDPIEQKLHELILKDNENLLAKALLIEENSEWEAIAHKENYKDAICTMKDVGTMVKEYVNEHSVLGITDDSPVNGIILLGNYFSTTSEVV